MIQQKWIELVVFIRLFFDLSAIIFSDLKEKNSRKSCCSSLIIIELDVMFILKYT